MQYILKTSIYLLAQ